MDEKIKFFDKYARNWDNHHTHREYDVIKDIFSRRVRLPIESRVLDVGAGTGIIIPFLQEQNINNLVAIDISQRMANQVKKNILMFQLFGVTTVAILFDITHSTLLLFLTPFHTLTILIWSFLIHLIC